MPAPAAPANASQLVGRQVSGIVASDSTSRASVMRDIGSPARCQVSGKLTVNPRPASA